MALLLHAEGKREVQEEEAHVKHDHRFGPLGVVCNVARQQVDQDDGRREDSKASGKDEVQIVRWDQVLQVDEVYQLHLSYRCCQEADEFHSPQACTAFQKKRHRWDETSHAADQPSLAARDAVTDAAKDGCTHQRHQAARGSQHGTVARHVLAPILRLQGRDEHPSADASAHETACRCLQLHQIRVVVKQSKPFPHRHVQGEGARSVRRARRPTRARKL
mmetsp:Transcript_63557/g.160377  ORF Transcript_63557/g.160377 Transcript_63557/m.160377 type:complete len:219 (+) Transcript_63557:991-1647(+)